MQLSQIMTGLVAVAVCVTALPTSSLAKREEGGVLLCQGADATGTCHYEVYSLEDCHDVPDGFSKNTKTFAPDGDDFYCWPRVGTCADVCMSPTGCTFGGALYFSHPAKYNLSEIAWDTSLMSFDCHKNATSA
ncbi:hypothetical protein F5Y15DRAFT_417370 [Xylariaceae sp. FL0016]|nr:hypothetical protein F5Y15DRAFT_417370 [Xylariaceae sp. FL0016]